MASNKGRGKISFWKRVWRILAILFLIQFFYILLLKWVDPPFTLTQLNALFGGDGLKRDYVDFAQMGVNSKLAVIASEDQLFPDHDGFDFKSIEKAMKHNKKSKSLRGASTISQQAAKNVFLWQSRSFIRKGLEVYFTFMIELIWGKKRILEIYLNVIETGPGVFGIEAAARHYFKKPANRLTRKEAAQIAACLPNPKLFTIKPISGRVAKRYPWVLSQMKNLEADPDIMNIIE